MSALAPPRPTAEPGPDFSALLMRLERELDVPYPERAMLLEEIAGDLEAAYRAATGRGLPPAAARAAATAELGLDDDAAASLAEIHQPLLRRALARLPPPAQGGVEWLAAVIPMLALVAYLYREVPMIQFLKDGGFGSILVLVIGAVGVLLLLHRALIWFVLKDHSPRGLGKNTATPLLLAGATLCAALLGTATDFYVVIARWSEGKLPDEGLRIGLRESLSPIILGAALATLILLGHGALQAGLRAIRTPAATP
jgi:hypothetical protein